MNDEERAALEAAIEDIRERQRTDPEAAKHSPGSYIHISTKGAQGTAYVNHDGHIELLGEKGQEMTAAMLALASELGKLEDDARERIVTLLEGLRDVKVEQILGVGNVAGWARVNARIRKHSEGD